MALAWPAALLPSDVEWWLDNSTRSGGMATSGAEQVVVGARPHWRATVVVPVYTKAQRLAANAFRWGMKGKVETVNLPVFQCRPAGDDMEAAAAAVIGDTTVDVTMNSGPGLAAGEYFSRLGNLYGVLANAAGTLTIWPPLRGNLGLGVNLEISEPYAIMQFVSDDGGAMMLTQLRTSVITFEFKQVF